MTDREDLLERMLTAAEQQNDQLVGMVQRIEGLSRLLRHRNSSFAGYHVADMIDRALSGVSIE